MSLMSVMSQRVSEVGGSNPSNAALLLFSGGLDSTAVLHMLLGQHFDVQTLFIDYGQAAASQEWAHAEKLARQHHVGLQMVQVKSNGEFRPGEITGRNSLLISVAVTFGSIGRGLLALGIHSGTGYYDCSPDFVMRMGHLVSEQTAGRLRLYAPFVDWTKRDIWDYCLVSNVPVGMTYSCETGGQAPCGVCPSCRDRRQLDAC
jgi:7-cyano-7-deazaguanine synthase